MSTLQPAPKPRPSALAALALSALCVLVLLKTCQNQRLADNFAALDRKFAALEQEMRVLREAGLHAPSSTGSEEPDSLSRSAVALRTSDVDALEVDLVAGAYRGSLYSRDYPAFHGAGDGRVPPLEVGRCGGTLRAPIRTDVDCFNPIVSKSLVTFGVMFLVFDPLFQLEPFYQELQPRLATGYQVSADLLDWTVHLRRGVEWADGRAFTADDVLFTFEVLRRPDVSSYDSQTFDYDVDGERVPVTVRKIDDWTVQFHQPLPYAAFREHLSNRAIIPAHRLREVAASGQFQRHWGVGLRNFEEHVGTGPFRLESHRKGTQITLVRNPLYWGRDRSSQALPYLDRIVLDVLETADVRFFRFKSAELDLLGDVPGDLVFLLKDLEKDLSNDVRVFDIGTEVGWSYLCFNQNPGTDPSTGRPLLAPHRRNWFQDVRFRRACSHAIDRATIVENVYLGLATPCYTPYPPSTGVFHNPATPRCQFDRREAARLLGEMGLLDRDGDGVREDADGFKVEFSLSFAERSPELTQLVGMVADHLEAIGLKVHRNRVDSQRLTSSIFERHDFEALISDDSGGAHWPSGDHGMFSSNSEFHVWHPRQLKPATPWEAEIDDLFRRASILPDKTQVLECLFRVQEILGEQQPLILLCSKTRTMACRGNLKNFRPGPTEPNVLSSAAEMFFTEIP